MGSLLKRASGIDLTTGALMLGGACLVAVSIVAAVVLLVPTTPALPAQPSPIVVATPERASVALPSDRVAAVLNVTLLQGPAAPPAWATTSTSLATFRVR